MKNLWKKLLAMMLTAIIFLAGAIMLVTAIVVKKNVTNVFIDMAERVGRIAYDDIDKTYPGDWSIDGDNLLKGDVVINDNFETLDSIKELGDCSVTIFMGDTRVSTNVYNEEGKRAIGTKATDAVVDEVINKGNDYTAIVDLFGVETRTYYMPIKDASGQVIGMFFVGIEQSHIAAIINKIVISVLICVIVMMIVDVALCMAITVSIVKPINKIKEEFLRLSENDFTDSGVLEGIKAKDEVGQMSKAAILMKDAVTNLIVSVKNQTSILESEASLTASKVVELNNNIDEVASTTEEISAGMEETAASLESNIDTIENIKDYVENLVEKANGGRHRADDISDVSTRIKKDAINQGDEAKAMLIDNRQRMEKAIEDSRSIEQISLLAETIMSIAAQTSLLSLNASIEAARAGESGRGFAVVANEIKTLSEASTDAVARIQEVVNVVLDSVNNLVGCSEGLMDYVDKNVEGAYSSLVSTGDQYYQDAMYIKEFAQDISDAAEGIRKSVTEMNISMNEIVTAVNESANGSTNIATSTASIQSNVEEVLQSSMNTKKSAQELETVMNGFQC